MRPLSLATLVVATLLSAPSWADTADTPSQPAKASSACVDVEVDGYRALSYDCLSQQMAPDAVKHPDNPALASEKIAQQPSNRLGLFNQSALSNRMGSNLGNSAKPQRPPAIQGTSPLLPGR